MRAQHWIFGSLLAATTLTTPAALAERAPPTRQQAPPPATPAPDPAIMQRVYSVLERGNRSGERITRALATEAFGALDPKTTEPYAIDALKDPVFEVRAAAISALVKIGDKAKYEPALIEELKNPKSDFGLLLGIVQRLAEPDAIRVVLAVMRDEKAASRNAIVDAFSHAPAPWFLAFFKALIADPNKALADTAQAIVLGMKDPLVMPILDQLLVSGSPDAKQGALDTISKLPKGVDLAGVRKLLKGKDKSLAVPASLVLARHGDKSAVPALLPGLTSGDGNEVIRTLDALLEVPTAEAAAAATAIIKNPSDNIEITKRVLELRARAGDNKLVDVLTGYRRTDDVRLQALAVYYLGTFEKSRALASLHEDVFHGDVNVQMAAIRALGNIGHHDSIVVLKRALDATNDPELKKALVESLSKIKDADIVPVLSFLVSDPIPEVRRFAILGLARSGTKDAVPTLKIGTQDSSVEARAEAIKAIVTLDPVEGPSTFRLALGWLPPETIEAMAAELGEGFAPYLDMALTSTRLEVQDAALSALTKLPAKEEGLLVTAYDRTHDGALKVRILRRLAVRRGLAELPRLDAAAKSGDMSLRVAAIELFGQIGDATVQSALLALLDDPDERIRVTVAVAYTTIESRLVVKKPGKRGR